MIPHLLNLATLARDTVDEPAAEFWTDPRLYRAVNRAADKVWRKCVGSGSQPLLRSHTFSTVSGTKLYALPDHLVRVRRVSRVESDGTLTPIDPVDGLNSRPRRQLGAQTNWGSERRPRHLMHGQDLELRPEPTSVYTVQVDFIPVHPDLATGTAAAGAASSITLASDADPRASYYVGARIAITSGTGAGQVRRISAYVGDTKVATVATAWTTAPDATSVYATLTLCPEWAQEWLVLEAVVLLLRMDDRDPGEYRAELADMMPDIRRLLRKRNTMDRERLASRDPDNVE